jgi:hypothetical protein
VTELCRTIKRPVWYSEIIHLLVCLLLQVPSRYYAAAGGAESSDEEIIKLKPRSMTEAAA